MNSVNKMSVEELRAFYKETGFEMAGRPDRDILLVRDELLDYLLSVLREEAHKPPEATPSEWSHLLDCLSHNKITPVLYTKLRGLPEELCPPFQVRESLAKRYLASKLYYRSYKRELKQVLAALSAKGVTPLVLKGGALKWLVYSDPVTRPSGDIDLLVREKDVNTCRSVLEELGFYNAENNFKRFPNFTSEDEFVLPETGEVGFAVEVHWDLFRYRNFFSIPIEELFENAIEVRADGFDFYGMALVDSFIHAAAHLTLFHNREVALFWIFDLYEMAKDLQAPGQWKELQEKCGRWNTSLAVVNALKLARMWTGLEIPGGFDDFAEWPAPTASEIETWNNSFQRYFNLKARYKLQWRGPARAPEKIRFMLHSLFPAPSRVQKDVKVKGGLGVTLSYLKHWGRYILKLQNKMGRS